MEGRGERRGNGEVGVKEREEAGEGKGRRRNKRVGEGKGKKRRDREG